jgi:hypothetical protein
MIKPKIYISGPMTGIEKYNFPLFNAAAKRLRKLGYTALNPAENFGGKPDGIPRCDLMRIDITMLLQADAIAMLPGWKSSCGAKLEHAIAVELNLPVWDMMELLTSASRQRAEIATRGKL